jgi:hypothetical protein
MMKLQLFCVSILIISNNILYLKIHVSHIYDQQGRWADFCVRTFNKWIKRNNNFTLVLFIRGDNGGGGRQEKKEKDK